MTVLSAEIADGEIAAGDPPLIVEAVFARTRKTEAVAVVMYATQDGTHE